MTGCVGFGKLSSGHLSTRANKSGESSTEGVGSTTNSVAGVSFDGVESSVLIDSGDKAYVGFTVGFPYGDVAHSQGAGVLSGCTCTEEAIVVATPAQNSGYRRLVSEGRAAGGVGVSL